MSYPYRNDTTENHAFRPVSGTHAYNSSYIHFDAQTRSKSLQTLIETHVSTPRQTQCPTPLHKADTRPPGPPGGGGRAFRGDGKSRRVPQNEKY
jgi:hypothetical protein